MFKKIPNNSLDKYKARLVAKSFPQKQNMNYFDIFSLVTRISLIRILNALVSIHTEMRRSHETLERHVLDVICPYNLQEMWWSEIPPNCYVSLVWMTSFLSIFVFAIFLRLIQKITQLLL